MWIRYDFFSVNTTGVACAMFVTVARGSAVAGAADIAAVLVSTSVASPTIDACHTAGPGACENATVSASGLYSLAVTGANATSTVTIGVLATSSGTPVIFTVLAQSQKCGAGAAIVPRRTHDAQFSS
jgi:hypothetical protein